MVSVNHSRSKMRLGHQLLQQLNGERHDVRIDLTRVRRSDLGHDVPGLPMVPIAMVASIPDQPGLIEVYHEPLSLVLEVTSVLTRIHVVPDQLSGYQHRGNLEIQCFHPFEGTRTIW